MPPSVCTRPSAAAGDSRARSRRGCTSAAEKRYSLCQGSTGGPPADDRALETSARCSGNNDGSHPASRLQFAPLDDYLAQAQKALRAAHNAMGEPRNRPPALCDAVYRQLQSLIAAADKRGRRG
jgi:hypothetical protein